MYAFCFYGQFTVKNFPFGQELAYLSRLPSSKKIRIEKIQMQMLQLYFLWEFSMLLQVISSTSTSYITPAKFSSSHQLFSPLLSSCRSVSFLHFVFPILLYLFPLLKWTSFFGSPEIHNKIFAAHWKHSNLFSPCTWPKREQKPWLFSGCCFFFLTCATVSFFCSHRYSILYHPVFSKVELMSLRSLILIFKWMMKKATACWSIGQPWLYWQCPLWLQSRAWKCNPLLVPLVSRSSGGRVGMELSFVRFKASTQYYRHTCSCTEPLPKLLF